MRRQWGSLFAAKSRTRRDAKGRPLVIGWTAQYSSPIDNRLIQKRFKPDQQGLAISWLDKEHHLVELHDQGVEPWTPPSAREKRKRHDGAHITFRQYAHDWLEAYRKHDGTRPEAASMRQITTAVNHCVDFFADKMLADITPADVDRFLDGMGACGEGGYARRRAYQRLKRMMRDACEPHGDVPPLIERNPCTRIAPGTQPSRQAQIPEATAEELKAIADAMPGYTRISVYMGAVFALRISEVCALQVRDIDFEHRVLHVRHGLRRGEGDVGALALKTTKTAGSTAPLPIPDGMVHMLEDHIMRWTDWPDDAEAMMIRPANSRIMSPNVLRAQFDKARVKAGRADLHFHSLRATGITLAAQAGDMRDTMVFGRHTDATVSLEHYQRSNDQRIAALTARVFDELVVPERTPDVVRSDIDAVTDQIRELTARLKALKSELDGLERDTPKDEK